MANSLTDSCLIKQRAPPRINSPHSLTCAGLWGATSGLLFFPQVFASFIHWTSEAASVYVLQPYWTFLTLALAYTTTVLTSNSDLHFALCIQGTRVSPFPLLTYLQAMTSWHTSPAPFLPLLCWFLINVSKRLLPMETQFTKLCSKLFLYTVENHPPTLK